MNMGQQRFGAGTELVGVARKSGAEIAAAYSDTQSYYEGIYYDTYAVLDPQGRGWKLISDVSIKPERKGGKSRVVVGDSYKAEMISLIYQYEDIETTQESVWKLREAEALVNPNCGIHVHIDISPFDAGTLHNTTGTMAAEEDLICKTLRVSVTRQNRWYKPVEERFLEGLNQKKPGTLEKVRQIWYNEANCQREYYDSSRYHCLNLHSMFQKGIVEFQLFSGTTHVDKIKAYIQLCLATGAQTFNQTSASRRKTQTTNEKYTF